jgi:hypothetical protein
MTFQVDAGVCSHVENARRIAGQRAPAPAEPTALERDRARHREFRDRRDGHRYETAVLTPRARAEKLWHHPGEDEV